MLIEERTCSWSLRGRSSCSASMPARPRRHPQAWCKQNEALLSSLLLKHGVRLLRGFNVDQASFGGVASVVAPRPMSYVGGIWKRDSLGESVYLSTAFPPEHTLSQHFEMAYMTTSPLKVLFFCDTPSPTGGRDSGDNCSRRDEEDRPKNHQSIYREEGHVRQGDAVRPEPNMAGDLRDDGQVRGRSCMCGPRHDHGMATGRCFERFGRRSMRRLWPSPGSAATS